MSETGQRRQPRQISEFGDVYGFLEEVRLRPGMWIPGSSLRHLESMLTGYRVALGVHDITETFDFWNGGPFSEWLWKRLGRHSSLGWATEIEREASTSGCASIDEFFALLDEYRAQPEERTAELSSPSNSPALSALIFLFLVKQSRLGKMARWIR